MKQVFVKPLLLLLVILAAASCDKDEKEIGYDALPQKARQFIAQYFPGVKCTRAVRDRMTEQPNTRHGSRMGRNWTLTDRATGQAWTASSPRCRTASCRKPSRRTSLPVTPMLYPTR